MDLEGLRMKAMTSVWDPTGGWSTPLPALDSPSTLVLVFGDRVVADDPRPLREIAASFPTSVVIGCSTAGQITGAILRDDVCSVAIMRFDRIRLEKVGADVSSSADSRAAGEALGAGLAADDLRSIFVLSDGLTVNGSELVAGLIEQVGSGVVVTGGLAGELTGGLTRPTDRSTDVRPIDRPIDRATDRRLDKSIDRRRLIKRRTYSKTVNQLAVAQRLTNSP